TGFPIAKIAAKLAVGYTLDELGNDITGGKIPASFEPTIDYIVTKVPRFAFEKFKGSKSILTTAMKSVGEAMSIGRSFEESLQKAMRSLEKGLTGISPINIGTSNTGDNEDMHDVLIAAIAQPTPQRLLYIAQGFRQGLTLEEINDISKFDPWFLERIRNIVNIEKEIIENGLPEDGPGWMHIKRMGFSDAQIANLVGKSERAVRKARHKHDIRPVYKRVDSCAAEIPSETAYMYSCYEGDGITHAENEIEPSNKNKVVILGGGPNRIGQGIEFDYCCVHAAYALKEAGYETIMVNCNPETVSTDYDTSDRLYFEPLTEEDVLELVYAEQQNGTLKGVIVQLGGQTPLKLAKILQEEGIPILGTDPDAIDLAEDRERFKQLIIDLDLRQPPNGLARSKEEALAMADGIGFPIVIRPSYVLGGQAMEIVHNLAELERYINTAVHLSGDTPVLLDRYLKSAIELDVDALCDGEDVYISGIMEHIEEAGVHSGDSACVLPPHSLSQKTITDINEQTIKLAKALNVKGLMNVQFAVQKDEATNEDIIYIIEVNPRASRTVPFVAKATGVPVAKLAARIVTGEPLSNFKDITIGMSKKHYAVKAPVFPFNRFPGVDPLLGPEMKSTGEVMGIDKDLAHAIAKSQLGAGFLLPTEGTVFISVKDADKKAVLPIAKKLLKLGFKIVATGGTCNYLNEHGAQAERINKVMQGQPNVADAIINEEIHLVINTTAKSSQAVSDSSSIRRMALMNKIPYYTLITAAKATVRAISALKDRELCVSSLQSFFENTKQSED
ncbi:MAG: carbamoyl-phosphate synthase large subunit, partial [Alphaproteobacteria bacterium]|nr:carbamoyl-phosphate synthase large subunit [Alphaproteobacteria bacterium]